MLRKHFSCISLHPFLHLTAYYSVLNTRTSVGPVSGIAFESEQMHLILFLLVDTAVQVGFGTGWINTATSRPTETVKTPNTSPEHVEISRRTHTVSGDTPEEQRSPEALVPLEEAAVCLSSQASFVESKPRLSGM